jgi:hypothetical protein
MVDYARLEHTVQHGGNRDRVGRIAMKKVGGTIERIDHPDQTVSCQLGAELLTHDPPGIVSGHQAVPDQALGVAVHFRNEIVPALGRPSARVRLGAAPNVVGCTGGRGPGSVH